MIGAARAVAGLAVGVFGARFMTSFTGRIRESWREAQRHAEPERTEMVAALFLVTCTSTIVTFLLGALAGRLLRIDWTRWW